MNAATFPAKTPRHVWMLSAITLAITLLVGCGKDGTASKDGMDGESEIADVPVGPPPTDDECAAFGEEMATALRAGDVSTFNRLVDWDSIFRRAEAGLDVPPAQSRQFRAGVRSTGGSYPATVADAVSKGAQFRYVRTRTRGGRKYVLMRMAGEEGLNYIEFSVSRRGSGEVAATDLYTYLHGEHLSQIMRRIQVLLLAAENRSLVDRLVGNETEFAKHFRDVEKLSSAVRSGDFQGGLAAYRKLPEKLRREKFILMQRMLCAQKASEAEYLESLDDLRRHFPDDPCIDFISIDAYALRGELDHAMACIDRLSKALEDDAALHTLRANLYLEQGNFKRVREAAGRAVEGGDNRPDPYYAVIVASLREQKHDETLDLLKQLAEKFDIVLNDLTSNPEYANFVLSSEFQSWNEHVADRRASGR